MLNNQKGRNPAYDTLNNTQGFDGSVNSDFYRIGNIPDALKKQLINYSAQDFDGIKEEFLRYVKAVYPDDYTNFMESDLGMMLAELIAYMGSVLSYKADAIAQEMYLSTAKSNNSVRKLLELIGVHLKGPNSSKASCTLTIQDSINALQVGESLTISQENRTVNSVSTRDGLPLSYTAYKLKPNGDIDTSSLTISLSQGDSVDSVGEEFPLIFLEGMFQIHEGLFSQVPTQQIIKVPYPSIIEGTLNVSSTDGIYTEIDSLFFASGSEHKVFEKWYNDD